MRLPHTHTHTEHTHACNQALCLLLRGNGNASIHIGCVALTPGHPARGVSALLKSHAIAVAVVVVKTLIICPQFMCRRRDDLSFLRNNHSNIYTLA